MSDHKLEALLDKCEQVAIESGAHQSYRACRDAFKELREALAAHKSEQEQAGEPVGVLRSDPYEGHVFEPRVDGDWSMLNKPLYTRPQQASMSWKYTGHNSHLNEDDYECSSCNKEWGFPIYTDPDKEKIGCPRCKLPYRK